MRRQGLWVSVFVSVFVPVVPGAGASGACSSTLGAGGANGGTSGAAGAGVTPRSSSMFGRPCVDDSDCGNAYLTCVPQVVMGCHDADAGVDAGSVFANLPVCPTIGQVTRNQCAARYEQPCQLDKDCGPAGFTCTPACTDGGAGASCGLCPDGTSCNLCAEETPSPCTADAQCPQGWSCSDLCPCGDADDALRKTCNPPQFLPVECPAVVCATAGQPDG
jgi:hypothetical protein